MLEGHYGTGDLEITTTRDEVFEKAKQYIDWSYDNS